MCSEFWDPGCMTNWMRSCFQTWTRHTLVDLPAYRLYCQTREHFSELLHIIYKYIPLYIYIYIQISVWRVGLNPLLRTPHLSEAKTFTSNALFRLTTVVVTFHALFCSPFPDYSSPRHCIWPLNHSRSITNCWLPTWNWLVLIFDVVSSIQLINSTGRNQMLTEEYHNTIIACNVYCLPTKTVFMGE